MREDQNSFKMNPIVAILILFEIIFAVFIIITINGLLEKGSEAVKVEILNYSIIPKASIIGDQNKKNVDSVIDVGKKDGIEGALYDEILLNNVGNIYNSGAKIREGSAHNVYISDLDVYVLNFIVDIENLQQSYRVVSRWADEYPNENIPANFPVVAFCLNDDELIYGDFNCKDEYNGFGEDAIAYDLLRYKSFDNAVLNLQRDDSGPLTISIYANSNEEADKVAAVNEVSSYLSSIGFSLEHFEYTVGTHFVF